MKKIILLLSISSLLLAGCWDERLYKDITIVPLIGYDGEQGDWTGHFTYAAVANPDSISFSTVEGNGISIEEARNDANRKIGELLDPSQVLVILLTSQAAKTNPVDLFDNAFRMPRTRLSSRLVIVEGDIAPYMEKTENMMKELPDYYDEALKTATLHSLIPSIDIHLAVRLLRDEGIDLQLPYMKMSDTTGAPEVAGIALFSQQKFTGHTLDRKESTIVQILKDNTRENASLSYEREIENKTYPVTFRLNGYKKKWDIKDDKIDATYKLKLSINEYAPNHLDEKKERKDLEDFLSKKMTNDFNDVIKKLQEAKSDPVGFGRSVRAFHPDLWNKGKWQDTFSELAIHIKVEVEITRTGIMN